METGEATTEVGPAIVAMRAIAAIVDMSPPGGHIVAAVILAGDGPMQHRMEAVVTAAAIAAAVTMAAIDS